MARSQNQDIDFGITRYEYGEPERAQRAVLQISTSKHYNGGISSSASVFWVGQHVRQQLVGLGTHGGDYSHRVKIDQSIRSVTQKAIDRQHGAVFTPGVVAQLANDARLHYAAVVAAGVDGFRNTYPSEVTA